MADEVDQPGDADSERRGARKDNPQEKTGTQVRLAHVLGIASTAGGPASAGGAIQRKVEHVSNEEIIYLAGKHVALFSYETQQHRFITKQQKTADIVAFATSANRKYVALAERLQEEKAGTGGSTEVSVWNLGADRALSGGEWQAKKVRVLSFAYLSKQPVVTLAFSRDNKYLATVTMHPEAYVYLWQLDKHPPKPLGMSDALSNTRVSQVSISPWNSEQLCTTGTSIFKFWKFSAPNQLKATAPMAKQRDYRYTSHTWFDDDRVVVGTMEGDVLVVENMELRKVIPAVHAENLPIWTTAWVGRGFVCAGDGGFLSLFERTYDQDYFQLSTPRSFQTPEKVRIVDVSVSPNEENIICTTDTNQLIQFNMANIDIMEPEKDSKDHSGFRPMMVGFHAETVTGVDVCVQKSIIVTSALDRRVRIWNFLKKRVEIDKQFDEEVHCVACHPSGLRIVVGFKYKIAMFNVLVGDLHHCQDFPVKNCKELQFSQGGQFFAAAVVTKVLVFNTYNFNCIASLTGHGSMVKSLCWTQHDQFIISAGFEGVILEWRVETMTKTDTEHPVQKAIAYSCVRFDEDTQMIAAVGSNKVAEGGLQEGWVSLRTLRVGDESDLKQGKEKELAKPLTDPLLLCPGAPRQKPAHTRTHTAECAISSFHRALFVGTPTGCLHVYRWPLRDGEPPTTQLPVHEGEVLFVVLSADERFLFTIGEDRTLFMFECETLLEERLPLRAGAVDAAEKRPRAFNFSTFDDVAYVQQQELGDRSAEVARLTEENERLERTQEQEKEQLAQRHKQEQEAKRAEVAAQRQQLQGQVAEAQERREEIVKGVAEKHEQQERQHMMAADKLEAHYKSRTEEMQRRYQELKDEKDDMIVRYDNMINMLEKQSEQEEQRLAQELEGLEGRMGQDIQILRQEREEQKQDLNELLVECENQFEEEVRDMLERFSEEDQKMNKELERWGRAKADRCNQESEDHRKIQQLRRECEDKNQSVHKLKQKNKEHEKTNDALRLEIQVRNDNIAASEKKILELKKQTAELEKLQYVLFFKFNELRKEVNPKEEQIAVMHERMDEMQLELQKIRDDREILRQALGGKNDKIRVVQKESESRVRILDSKERLLRSLLRDLSELLSRGDTKRLVYDLRDKVTAYASKYEMEHGSEGKATVHEFHRQRSHMEKRLSAAEKQNDRRRDNLQKDNQRKTSENALLVREINDLRHEKKHILAKALHVEEQVKEARAALARSGQPQPGVGSPAARPASQLSPPRRDHAAGPAAAATVTGSRPQTACSAPGARGAAARGARTVSGTKLKEITTLDPVRIAAIVQQVERNNAEMTRQQEEIRRLRDFVSHLLARAEMDGDLTAQQLAENAQIRARLALGTAGSFGKSVPDEPDEAAGTDAPSLPAVRSATPTGAT